MLVIRFARAGRRNQPVFRIVLAEKARSATKKFKEVLGSYNVSEGKKVTLNKERINYWVNQGAQPSDSVAALLVQNGMKEYEKFMSPRDKKRAKKNPTEEAAPVEEAAEVKEEAPAEEAAPAEEVKEEVKEEEAEAKEDAPAEEAPAAEEEKEEASE